MKQFLRKLHLWLSIPFGLLITLICLTGALLIFEKEVVRKSNKSLLYIEPKDEPMEMLPLCNSILSQLPEGAKISGITIYPNPDRSYEVDIAKPHRQRLFANQYTGKVLGEQKRSPFFEKVSLLHRRMLDGSKEAKVGKQVVGITSISFVLILISGVVLWWPKNWRRAKKSLRIRIGRGQYAFWYDFHVALGVYVTLFLLGCTVTGLMWTYDWVEQPLYALFGASQPKEKMEHAPINSIGEGYDAWGTALHSVPIDRYASVQIRKGVIQCSLVGWGNYRASDDYYFNETTGQVTEVLKYVDKSRYEKVRGWTSTIHLGRWGGSFSRWVTFAVMLLGGSLSITGYYLWWRRCWSKRRRKTC